MKMHFPRLTREEEIALAQAIAAGKEAQQKLADGAYSDGEREALELLVEEGQRARERLAEANIPLALSLAQRFEGLGVEFEELRQEAFLALMKAVDTFDWRRGKFSTYAWRAITRGLKKYVRAQGFALSLDAPLTDDDDGPLLVELIPAPDSPNVGEVEEEELKEAVRAVLETLPQREAEMVWLYYGEGETLCQIGERYGISGERVRQILERAMGRLRHPARLRKLHPFL
jgi:RNA polymerase primary sigma factor